MNELRSHPNERNPETKIVKKSLKEFCWKNSGWFVGIVFTFKKQRI